MPRTRKTLDEQLEALKQKKQAIEKQVSAIESRKRKDDHKLDSRRKIIVGAAVLAHAAIDPEFGLAVQIALQKAVAPKDRPIVMDLMRHGGIKRAADAARARVDAAKKRQTLAVDETPAKEPARPERGPSSKPPEPAAGQPGR